MMDPTVFDEWLAALRSGEYEQGQSHPAWAGKYCCLGVLCDLQGHLGENSGRSWPIPPVAATEPPMPYMGLSPALQTQLAKINDGELAPDGTSWSDTHAQNGATFEDIAAYLESNRTRICGA